MNNFFIIGSPRSGTTILRELLKQNTNFICPEETNFYRWPFGYRSNEFHRTYEQKVLKLHRSIDKVGDNDFKNIISKSNSRKDFFINYMDFIIKSKRSIKEKFINKNYKQKVWFEKTPQHIYGLPLLISDFPEAKFLFLIRHPYYVVKSLLDGKVMKVNDIVGAISYWTDSVKIIDVLSDKLNDKLLTIDYNKFTLNPKETLNMIETFVGEKKENFFEYDCTNIYTQPSINKVCKSFEKKDLLLINKLCSYYMEKYDFQILN